MMSFTRLSNQSHSCNLNSCFYVQNKLWRNFCLSSRLYIDIKKKSVALDVFFLKKKKNIFPSYLQALADINMALTSGGNGIQTCGQITFMCVAC